MPHIDIWSMTSNTHLLDKLSHATSTETGVALFNHISSLCLHTMVASDLLASDLLFSMPMSKGNNTTNSQWKKGLQERGAIISTPYVQAPPGQSHGNIRGEDNK